jgi:hypothetical protein
VRVEYDPGMAATPRFTRPVANAVLPKPRRPISSSALGAYSNHEGEAWNSTSPNVQFVSRGGGSAEHGLKNEDTVGERCAKAAKLNALPR